MGLRKKEVRKLREIDSEQGIKYCQEIVQEGKTLDERVSNLELAVKQLNCAIQQIIEKMRES